jgi:hypothetical protein
MADKDPNPLITKWLRGKGYSEAEIQKIRTRLAEHDQQTLTDSIFDSIGNSDKTLDQLIGDLLRE